VAKAEGDATAWYTVNNEVYRLNSAANYTAEQSLVIGSTVHGYTALEGDLTDAISADQAVFDAGATSAANALGQLEGVVIAASLLMAAGCAWAISRRLAEYR
jgi:soluble lytic murein transglycosylase-like protein